MNGRLLLIDKPAGITSHDVVDRVRRICHTRRVGHAGTLDPFATGLLIVGVDAATKELTGLVGLEKTYEATLRLGATSTTFDPEGTITESATTLREFPQTEIEMALDRFRGGYDQRAPLHSAKKIGGKKLYELARTGTATEDMRPMKRVEIPELVITR
jgi:tRNA pseudouridine55 synthase